MTSGESVTSGESLDFYVVRSLTCPCGRINVLGPRQLEVPGKKTLTKDSGEFCLVLFLTVMRKLLEPRTGEICLHSLGAGCSEVQRAEKGTLGRGSSHEEPFGAEACKDDPVSGPREHRKEGHSTMTLLLKRKRAPSLGFHRIHSFSKQGVLRLRFFRGHSL